MPIELFGCPPWVPRDAWDRYVEWQRSLVWHLDRLDPEKHVVGTVLRIGVRFDIEAIEKAAARLDKVISKSAGVEERPRARARATLQRLLKDLKEAGAPKPRRGAGRPSGEVTTTAKHVLIHYRVTPTTMARFLQTLTPPARIADQWPGHGDAVASWAARFRQNGKSRKHKRQPSRLLAEFPPRIKPEPKKSRSQSR